MCILNECVTVHVCTTIQCCAVQQFLLELAPSSDHSKHNPSATSQAQLEHCAVLQASATLDQINLAVAVAQAQPLATVAAAAAAAAAAAVGTVAAAGAAGAV
jgi:hypothetical protein